MTWRQDRLADDLPGRQIACRHELLAHLLERLLLARERAFHPVSESLGNPPQIAHQPPHAFRHERERMIDPFHAWLSVKCFSMTRAPSM